METVPYDPPHFPLIYDQVTEAPMKNVYQEIVEISSDEDEDMDDGQPESSRRETQAWAHTKRTVVIDSDEEDVGTQLDELYRFLEPPPMKRPKLVHADYADDVIEQPFDFTDLIDFTSTEAPELSIYNPDIAPSYPDLLLDNFKATDDKSALAFRTLPSFESGVDPVLAEVTPTKPEKPTEHRLSKAKTKGKEKASLRDAPYYDDPTLEARMYRGPGFEQFPVVLGCYPEYQEVCDEWDRAQAKRAIRLRRKQERRSDIFQFTNVAGEFSSDEDDDVEHPTKELTELECLHKIREILPDIQRDFAMTKVREYLLSFPSYVDEGIEIQPNPGMIVSQILEYPDYPKQEKSRKSKGPASDGTGITIEWQKGVVGSKAYQQDAVCLLATQFAHVPTHFIYKTIQDKQSLFESYLHINDLNLNYDRLPSKHRPYRRTLTPRLSLEKKYTLKTPDQRSKQQWECLVNELQAARQQAERHRIRAAQEERKQAAEEANLQEHKAKGNLVECQCCFDDEIPINRAVSCQHKDIHWFCFGCVLRLAENQIGSMKHEMRCMHQSGCKADLAKDGVARAVPGRVVDKLAFYQQQQEITAACIEGLEQCAFCDFKAICDPIEISSVFQCQNPDCLRVSCRKCHEDSHLPKSCEEVKCDRRLSARHQVEEARSEAMMRPCPKCKVKIIKEMGCNKMKCGLCGCIMCYVCKADISNRKDGGYAHFNETGAKCILYDKGFDRHEQEADEAEQAAIKKVQAENADIDEKQLQIETGKAKAKVAVAAAGLEIPQFPMPNEINIALHQAFRPRPRPTIEGGLPYAHQFRFEPLHQRGVEQVRPQPLPLYEHENNHVPRGAELKTEVNRLGNVIDQQGPRNQRVQTVQASAASHDPPKRYPGLIQRPLPAIEPDLIPLQVPRRRMQAENYAEWLPEIPLGFGVPDLWPDTAPKLLSTPSTARVVAPNAQRAPLINAYMGSTKAGRVEKGKANAIQAQMFPEQGYMNAGDFIGNLFTAPLEGIDFDFAPEIRHRAGNGAKGVLPALQPWEVFGGNHHDVYTTTNAN